MTHLQEEELTPLPTEDVKDEEDDEVWANLETVIDKTSTKKQEGKRGSAAENIGTANTPKKKKKKKGVWIMSNVENIKTPWKTGSLSYKQSQDRTLRLLSSTELYLPVIVLHNLDGLL